MHIYFYYSKSPLNIFIFRVQLIKKVILLSIYRVLTLSIILIKNRPNNHNISFNTRD